VAILDGGLQRAFGIKVNRSFISALSFLPSFHKGAGKFKGI